MRIALLNYAEMCMEVYTKKLQKDPWYLEEATKSMEMAEKFKHTDTEFARATAEMEKRWNPPL